MRDSQKSKVYNAERVFFGDYHAGLNDGYFVRAWDLPPIDVERGTEIAELLAVWFDMKVPSVRFKRSAGHRSINEGAWASYGRWSVTLGRKCPEWVMVHEVAHLLTYHRMVNEFGYAGGWEFAAHGPEFVRCYADAVGAWYGDDVGDRLRQHMGDRRVKVADELRAKPESDVAPEPEAPAVRVSRRNLVKTLDTVERVRA